VSDVAETRPLIAREEERAVFHDGASDCPAVLIPLQRIAPGCKEISRIENRIAIELEDIAVHLVRSRLRHDVHHTAGILSIFSAEIAGLDTELLKRVRKGKRLVDVGVFIEIIAPVEHVADLILPRTISRYRDRTGYGFRRPLVRSGIGRADSPRH